MQPPALFALIHTQTRLTPLQVSVCGQPPTPCAKCGPPDFAAPSIRPVASSTQNTPSPNTRDLLNDRSAYPTPSTTQGELQFFTPVGLPCDLSCKTALTQPLDRGISNSVRRSWFLCHHISLLVSNGEPSDSYLHIRWGICDP